MLTCREITEIVTDYVEGRMSLWERVRFQLHLGMCTHCRTFVEQMRIAREANAALPPLPPETQDQLLERFRDWKRSEGAEG